MDKIKKIKDWLKPYLEDRVRDEHEEGFFHCAMLLNDFIDTLSDESNKSLEEIVNVNLEKEINRYFKGRTEDECDGVCNYQRLTLNDCYAIARHFYELGQKDAANKYDEVEYNRQRAVEEMSDKTLDEEADNFVWEVMENDEEGISDLCRKLRPSSKISDFYDALGEFFKAGAKWMAGQGAQLIVGIKVNGMGQPYLPPEYIYLSGLELKEGDKVIVQIRKKEESK